MNTEKEEKKRKKFKFTKAKVAELINDPDTYRDEQSDAGFGLRVSPKGKATYFVEFDFKGKHYFESFGRVPGTGGHGVQLPEMQPDDARDKARWLRLQIENPADKAAPLSLRDAFEAYVTKKRRKPGDISLPLSARSQKSYRACFNQHLQQYADQDFRSLGESTWREIYDCVVSGKDKSGKPVMLAPKVVTLLNGRAKQVLPARPAKGSIAQGHILMSAVGAMYKFHRVPNPIQGLRQDEVLSRAPKARKDWVNFQELRSFVKSLLGLRSKNTRDALLITLLTNFRSELVLGMRKDRLNCDACTYLVDQEDDGYKRAKTLLFPISPWLVKNVLRPRMEEKGSPHPKYLFPATTGKSETIKSLAHTLGVLEKTFGKRVNSNDLRRTFTTIGQWLGTNPMHLERLTGHKESEAFKESGSRIMGEYVMTETELLRPSLNRIANAILEIAGVQRLSKDTRTHMTRDFPTLLAELSALPINKRAA